VESNSQGCRYICIPLEEEDPLDPHLASTKQLLDVGDQNESFLIHTTEARGRSADATICLEFESALRSNLW